MRDDGTMRKDGRDESIALAPGENDGFALSSV